MGGNKSLLTIIPLLMVSNLMISCRAEPTQPALISADTAVNIALQVASLNSSPEGGGIVGEPTEIRGKVMTLDEATQLIHGRPDAPDTLFGKMRENLVWLIILHGTIIEHVPAAPGVPGKPGIPSKDILHEQMAVIIIATTGDPMEAAILPSGSNIERSLPFLQKPIGPVPPAPTRLPISPIAPFPTRQPAPTSGAYP